MQSILNGKDIVIVSIQPWYYELGSNCKNIARWFSKDNRVLYVNIPITRKTFHSKSKSPGIQEHCRIIRGESENLVQIENNLWQLYPTRLIESINFLPSTSLFEWVNRINGRRFARDIISGINKLGFKDFILFNDNDIYNGFWLGDFIKPRLNVYYMRDFLQGYDFWSKHSKIIEPKIIRRSDIVVANSTYYQEYAGQFNPKSYYVGQGCNLDLFNHSNEFKKPPELEFIQAPQIGYVGALDSARLDIDLIENIARSKPNWSVVLVGPEDEKFQKSNLHQYSNIHFLGRKEMKQLPAFVQYFDVCINPQQVNTITTGNYPLKIDEYLAMGKAVVATRTEAMKLFADYCFLANTPEEYPALIENALEIKDPSIIDLRVKFASSHTWENSVGSIYKAILDNLKLN